MADAGYCYLGGAGVADEIEYRVFSCRDNGLKVKAKAGVEDRNVFMPAFLMYGKGVYC